jgi:hypothetical protein
MRSGESENGYIRAAFELMDEIDRLGDENAIRDRLAVLLSACGFEHFVVARLPQPRENIGPAMLLKRWPLAWQSRYDRHGYYRYDPASRHCFETIEPFLWSELRMDPRADPWAIASCRRRRSTASRKVSASPSTTPGASGGRVHGGRGDRAAPEGEARDPPPEHLRL